MLSGGSALLTMPPQPIEVHGPAAIAQSDEPSLAPLTPDLARSLIATVGRLAHAELALHALVVSQERLRGQSHDVPAGGDGAALDALGASLATRMSALAVSLRTLQPPASAPAGRPVPAATNSPRGVDGTVRAATEGLVDAVGTLDALVRDRLVWPAPANGPARSGYGYAGREEPKDPRGT